MAHKGTALEIAQCQAVQKRIKELDGNVHFVSSRAGYKQPFTISADGLKECLCLVDTTCTSQPPYSVLSDIPLLFTRLSVFVVGVFKAPGLRSTRARNFMRLQLAESLLRCTVDDIRDALAEVESYNYTSGTKAYTRLIHRL